MPFSSADPNAFLGLGIQTGIGVPQTTANKFRFCRYLAGTALDAVEDVIYLREGGDGLDRGYTYKKTQKVQGQIVFNARPEFLGQLLAVVPGGATWDGGSAPALHTFHTGHASHPWSTLQIGHPGTSIVQFVSDVRFSGLTFEGIAGEPVKITAPFVGITHGASSTVLTATDYGETPFLFHSNPTYVLDGSGDTTVTAFKMDFVYALDQLQAQAISLAEIPVMNREVNVDITRRYEGSSQWTKVVMGGGLSPTTSVATGALRVGYKNDGAGATLRDLQINAPLLAYHDFKLSELDPDGKTIIETMSAAGLKGGTYAAWFTVKSQHASQYAT